MTSSDSIHKFELAGMGKAPFKVVGFYAIPSKSLAEQNPNAYNLQLQAMPKGIGIGSCSFCSTPLTNNYILESKDGKKSVVGCDCVQKVGDAGLTSKIKEMQKEARREAREAKRQAEYEAQLEAQREANGGKTDDEIYQEKVEAHKQTIEAGKAKIKEDLREIGSALNYASGDFARNMYQYLRAVDFNQISPNMQRIIIEIAAKQISGSRKNSKKYNAEYDRLEPVLEKAREDYDKLMADNPMPRR